MIRKATNSDISRIYELGSMLHKNYCNVNDLDKMLKEEYFKVFVAEEKGEIVGFLSATELYETIDILDLYVLPEFRRKHIASGLINYMISDASDRVSLVTLEVAVDNQSAVQLYQKFGFEIACKRLFYYGDKDAYLMGLRCKRE